MEDQNPSITVQCLRGRLHAERVASKAANEAAQIFNNKLKELEEQLKIESKCRRRAERKLNNLKKKLESLNITLHFPQEIDKSSSSDRSEISLVTSTTCTDEAVDRVVEAEAEAEAEAAEDGEVTGKAESKTGEKQLQDTQERHGSREVVVKEKTNKEEKESEEMEGHGVDNSMELALVPVRLAVESHDTCSVETKTDSESVRQVLDILRHIRENIQNTMEKRRFIYVS